MNMTHAEPANDTLTINALAGADNVDASALDAVGNQVRPATAATTPTC